MNKIYKPIPHSNVLNIQSSIDPVIASVNQNPQDYPQPPSSFQPNTTSVSTIAKAQVLPSPPFGMQFNGYNRLPVLAYTFGKSNYVYLDSTSTKLTYAAYSNQNDTISDFSTVGYMNSEAPIPNDIPVVMEVFPSGDSDDTDSLQKAIDFVGSLPVKKDGFRGALFLHPGSYSVSGTLR